MAYAKQNFADGQTLAAAHLNHIEDGLFAHGTELDDLRVDFWGNTHETAGDAVRYQFGELESSVSSRLENIEARIGGTIVPATVE